MNQILNPSEPMKRIHLFLIIIAFLPGCSWRTDKRTGTTVVTPNVPPIGITAVNERAKERPYP